VNSRLKIRAYSLLSLLVLATSSSASAAADGDSSRGRALVANRQQSMCLLCHQAPIPEARFQGDLGPPLEGVGSRLNAQQLRARLVDSRAVQPDSIMPAYGRTAGLRNVAARYVDQPIFSDQQLDDVLAYLLSLR
jgi:L-cysteine S-thiosulfotransferase